MSWAEASTSDSSSDELSYYSRPIALFHPFHGENIELREQRMRARRKASFDRGIVFSDRSLGEREMFHVSVENVEGGWTGHLRMGLTWVDPNARPSQRDINDNSWLLSVNPSLLPFNLNTYPLALPSEKGSLIGIYYERCHEEVSMHLLLNGFDFSPSMTMTISPSKPLYAVVDVFGSTKEIRVVTPRPREPPALSSLCYDRVSDLVRAGQYLTNVLPKPIRRSLEDPFVD